ncbi:DUF2326 domain-containing protein [Glutamicibacter halophytocola]|nr:DUF2326 domain-containing protein [Glutamicibacter halophytocola]
MLLKTLRIVNGVSLNTLRTVNFNSGVNFVVDNEESKSQNKVGKTTFLMLIYIALGSKDRKVLYTHPDNGVINEPLRQRISAEKIFVELTLADSLVNSSHTITTKVELFPQGRRFINNVPYSEKGFLEELNRQIFDNEHNSPRFRQLLTAFVRVSEKRDRSQILKYLGFSTSNAEYHSIYQFLFKLEDPSTSKRISDLQAEIKKNRDSKSRLIKLINEAESQSSDSKNLAEYLPLLEARSVELQRRVDEVFLDSTGTQDAWKDLTDLRIRYAQLTSSWSRIVFEIDRTENAINRNVGEQSSGIDEDVLQEFYEEIREYFPGIKKKFNDLVDFNKALSHNKLKFFEQNLASLVVEKEALGVELEELRALLAPKTPIESIPELDGAVELFSDSRELNIRLGILRERAASIAAFDENETRLKDEINSLNSNRDINYQSPEQKIRKFNEYFGVISEKLLDISPRIEYAFDLSEFPLKFTNIDETSTGTDKTLMASFDFSYQLYARYYEISSPRFIVHDLLESISGSNLQKMFHFAESNGIQFVTAILSEKLESSGLTRNEISQASIVSFTGDNRVFGD